MDEENKLIQRITGKPDGLRIVTFASFRFPLPDAGEAFIRHELSRLIASESGKGPVLFLTDLAGDFQKAAAEETLKLRNLHPRIELGVFPMLRLWDVGPLAERADYAAAFTARKDIRTLAAYRLFLAEHTDRFLCYFTERQLRHAELARMAREKGKELCNLYPAYIVWKQGAAPPHGERED